MKLKTLSLYRDFVDLLHRKDYMSPKHINIGGLKMTMKLVNTAELSAESKLAYAYLFFHSNDITGIRVPLLSRILGMTAEQTRNSLNELIAKKHIKLITTRQNADFSELTYYYAIVNPEKYGMSDLEEELLPADNE